MCLQKEKLNDLSQKVAIRLKTIVPFQKKAASAN
jgi:hypothetical protein